MGQTNENENPELILEKLKSLNINDENNTSLDKSFNTIKKILIDYKFYKDMLKKTNNRKSISFIQRTKFSSNHEYSKEELLNIMESLNVTGQSLTNTYIGYYDKIRELELIIMELEEKIEKLKGEMM